MKKAFLIAGSFFVLVACNESGQQGANENVSDTSSHNASNTAGTDTITSGDSGNMEGQTMMAIMERNMDQMKEVRSLGSSDKDFASMMKIHHMGATEMARLHLAQGTDQQLKDMAQRMINEQQREMESFDAFLAKDNFNSAATDKNSPFYDRVMKELDGMKMENGDHSGSADQQFVHVMIPHHKGGIAMADQYLKGDAKDQNLKSIATKLKADQQKEVQQMQTWLNNNKPANTQ